MSVKIVNMTGKDIVFKDILIPKGEEAIRVASMIADMDMEANGIPCFAEIKRKYALAFGFQQHETLIVEDLETILPDMEENTFVCVGADVFQEVKAFLPWRFDVCMLADGNGFLFNATKSADFSKFEQ
jgi:hypothetical protein